MGAELLLGIITPTDAKAGIGTIIASTGLAGFSDQWLAFINTNLNPRDVEELSDIAQRYLVQAYKKYVTFIEDGDLSNYSTTIYHFGFSSSSEKMLVYAHRSSKEFKPELIEYGIGIEPICVLPEVDSNENFANLIPGIMERQRAEQAVIAEGKRVSIGGEIFAWHLKKDGCHSFRIGEFEDYAIARLYVKARE